MPEPRAKLHEIQAGESAIGIAEQYYRSHAQEWGQDLRFYVNVLEFVNRGEGERGIYREGSSWETTKTRSGYLIWIPSVSFAKQLRGTVSSGSITHEAWESVKSAAVAVGEFIVGGGAFVAGLLHGALESVWDLLVGLKDLVVMVWDTLKSLLTGEILSDAKSLWDQVSNLDVSQIAEAWINDFEKKWDHESLLKRWHFRGWVLGYAIAEIVMLIFSGGAAAAAKWGGKMAKVAKVIGELPTVARLAKKARSVDVPDAVKKALAKGAGATSDALKVARAWASTRLNLGAEILKDLTLEAINRLRTLSEPLLNKLRDLPTVTKKFVLGCQSECKVDIGEIKEKLDRLFWGHWSDYPKITVGGREYAQIGDHLYTEHAVNRMQPRGLGRHANERVPDAPEYKQGAGLAGRSISPTFVDEVIRTGTMTEQVRNGVLRHIYQSGSVTVVTEQAGRIVITVITH